MNSIFFDNGKTVLLGQEHRKRYNKYTWMEFGGNPEANESLAETACREANEETAYTLGITIEQVLSAESKGHYIDYHNEATGIFYHMRCLILQGEKPNCDIFKVNSEGKNNVEKVNWKYFNASDIIHNRDGLELYETMCTRLDKLIRVEFFKNWI